MMVRFPVPLLLCALWSMPVHAQQPSPAADKNTAVIRGRITALDSGRPLRRAQVTVSAAVLRERKSTGTNVRGEFELTGLPAGRYTINVTRSGYLTGQYGQRRPGAQSKVLELAEGQTLEKLEISLLRAGVISGRVADENGEPVPNVTVWAMRPYFFRGRRELARVASAQTDDIGQYRILGLTPGEYTVQARIRETWSVPGPPKQVLGYVPTYFPSTARLSEALRVKLGPGEEAPSTDISLVAAPAASISGTVMRSNGEPLAGGRVSLSENAIGPFGASYASVTGTTAAADGSWQLRMLPPGEYELSVSTESRDGGRESATHPIVLQGTDISGVTLTTDAGGVVTGHVATDDGQPLPAPSGGAKLRVVVENIGPGARPPQIVVGDDNGIVAGDGRFTFTASSGRGLVKVWGLPRGWAVKSVATGDRDGGDDAITVSGGQTQSVRVVLTSKFPTVAGAVTDDRGAPADGAVLIFPADEARWLGTIDNVHTSGLDQTGRFRFDDVRPGDYIAIALEDIEQSDVADPAFLRELHGRGTRITIREGEPLQLNLKVTK